uniref:Uncharacterized protein n=1 Tax=Parascaris equorum TaxID=6256 RepID=A0A914RG09_PAREQ
MKSVGLKYKVFDDVQVEPSDASDFLNVSLMNLSNIEKTVCTMLLNVIETLFARIYFVGKFLSIV